MKALVIVHLSSLDAYARQAGMDEAFALADRLKNAILGWNGPVYVVDQRWPIDKWAKPRWELVTDVQLKREIRWSHFDDTRDDWGLFVRHFRAQLIRDGVKNVVLGGVWYHPGSESGCVSDIYRSFKKYFHATVDENLVGCWSGAA